MSAFSDETFQKGCTIMETKKSLDSILNPKSVAVVGASTDPFKWGYMLLNAVKESGFEGDIYPINPKGGEILGLPVYTSVKEVPGTSFTDEYTGSPRISPPLGLIG